MKSSFIVYRLSLIVNTDWDKEIIIRKVYTIIQIRQNRGIEIRVQKSEIRTLRAKKIGNREFKTIIKIL